MNSYEHRCEKADNLEEMPQILPPTLEDMAKSWEIVAKMKSRLEAPKTWIPITGDCPLSQQKLPELELFDSCEKSEPCGAAEPTRQTDTPTPYYNAGLDGNHNYQKPGAGESAPPWSNPYPVHKPGVDI